MVQFYFLTIVFLVLGALILLSEEYGEKFPTIVRLQHMVFRNQTNTIVLLVLTAVSGILKLISPINPGPVVLGDLFPAIALISVAVFYSFEMKGLGAEAPMKEDDLLDDPAFVDSELVDKAEGSTIPTRRSSGMSFSA